MLEDAEMLNAVCPLCCCWVKKYLHRISRKSSWSEYCGLELRHIIISNWTDDRIMQTYPKGIVWLTIRPFSISRSLSYCLPPVSLGFSRRSVWQISHFGYNSATVCCCLMATTRNYHNLWERRVIGGRQADKDVQLDTGHTTQEAGRRTLPSQLLTLCTYHIQRQLNEDVYEPQRAAVSGRRGESAGATVINSQVKLATRHQGVHGARV